MDYWPGKGTTWVVGSMEKGRKMTPIEAVSVALAKPLLPEGSAEHLNSLRQAQSPQAKSRSQIEYARRLLAEATEMEIAELKCWEAENLNGHSIGTMDWPGWQQIRERLESSAQQKKVKL